MFYWSLRAWGAPGQVKNPKCAQAVTGNSEIHFIEQHQMPSLSQKKKFLEDIRVPNCHYLLTLSVSIPDMNSCSTVKLSKKSSDALGKEQKSIQQQLRAYVLHLTFQQRCTGWNKASFCQAECSPSSYLASCWIYIFPTHWWCLWWALRWRCGLPASSSPPACEAAETQTAWSLQQSWRGAFPEEIHHLG